MHCHRGVRRHRTCSARTSAHTREPQRTRMRKNPTHQKHVVLHPRPSPRPWLNTLDVPMPQPNTLKGPAAKASVVPRLLPLEVGTPWTTPRPTARVAAPPYPVPPLQPTPAANTGPLPTNQPKHQSPATIHPEPTNPVRQTLIAAKPKEGVWAGPAGPRAWHDAPRHRQETPGAPRCYTVSRNASRGDVQEWAAPTRQQTTLARTNAQTLTHVPTNPTMYSAQRCRAAARPHNPRMKLHQPRHDENLRRNMDMLQRSGLPTGTSQ